MAFRLDIAGFSIGIEVSAETRSALMFCESYFQGFAGCGKMPAATVKIIRHPLTGTTGPSDCHHMEHRITAGQLKRCLGNTFTVADDAICAACLGGLLAYNPATRSARLFLCGPDPTRYAPLFRLLWMFLAQTLGELGCFFVHAAPVAGRNCGYLFCGDSGQGKTTLAANAESGRVLADDGPVVARDAGTGFRLHASPYHQQRLRGKHRPCPSGSSSASLNAIYFLDKEGRCPTGRLAPAESVPVMLQRFVHFWGYLSPAARLLAFDLFREACYILPVKHLTLPLGVDVLTCIEQPHMKRCAHDR